MPKDKTAVMVGNPREGYKVYGPFENDEEATDWALTKMGLDIDWWPVPLLIPESNEE